LDLDGVITKSINVTFNNPFTGGANVIPKCVMLSPTVLDSDKSLNLRYGIKYSNLSKVGFTIDVNTWGDTHIYQMNVQWLVII
jgi:hypothetical protein